jgi:hypothetical protein
LLGGLPINCQLQLAEGDRLAVRRWYAAEHGCRPTGLRPGEHIEVNHIFGSPGGAAEKVDLAIEKVNLSSLEKPDEWLVTPRRSAGRCIYAMK